jgi:hypothetical protein
VHIDGRAGLQARNLAKRVNSPAFLCDRLGTGSQAAKQLSSQAAKQLQSFPSFQITDHERDDSKFSRAEVH